jgi:hypothetical protein
MKFVEPELAGQITGRLALPAWDSVTEAADFRLRELIDKLGNGRNRTGEARSRGGRFLSAPALDESGSSNGKGGLRDETAARVR